MFGGPDVVTSLAEVEIGSKLRCGCLFGGSNMHEDRDFLNEKDFISNKLSHTQVVLWTHRFQRPLCE